MGLLGAGEGGGGTGLPVAGAKGGAVWTGATGGGGAVAATDAGGGVIALALRPSVASGMVMPSAFVKVTTSPLPSAAG